MVREGKMLGVIGVGWQEPGPISQVHEELLKTFADQAVIAIENVRLFNELRDRERAVFTRRRRRSSSRPRHPRSCR
jgi:GAF domain-containing protein